MNKKFYISDDLINEIQLGNQFKIHVADTLCIFDYDHSAFDTNDIAKTLTDYVKKILKENEDYKVICINSNEVLNLIFVVFDLKD